MLAWRRDALTLQFGEGVSLQVSRSSNELGSRKGVATIPRRPLAFLFLIEQQLSATYALSNSPHPPLY